MNKNDDLNEKFGAGFTPAEGMVNAITINAVKFNGKDPDEIRYLLLLNVFFNDGYDYDMEDTQFWVIKVGRQAVYNYLKNIIESDAIDVDRSFIMAEDSTMKTAKSIYNFMKEMKEGNGVIDNTDFDIDTYTNDDNKIGDGTLLDVISESDTDISGDFRVGMYHINEFE